MAKRVFNIFDIYYKHINHFTLDVLISVGLLKEELITRPIGLREEYSYFIENTFIENAYTLVNTYNINSNQVKEIEKDINEINPTKRVFVSSIEFLNERFSNSIINKYMSQNINDTIYYIDIVKKVKENFYDVYDLTLKHIKKHPFLTKENRIKENTITIDELFTKNTLLITNEDEVILLYFKEAHKYYSNMENIKKIYKKKIENSVAIYSLDDINIYKFYDAITNRKLYVNEYLVTNNDIITNNKNRENLFNITLSNNEKLEFDKNLIKRSLYSILLKIDDKLINENLEIKKKHENNKNIESSTIIGIKRNHSFIENTLNVVDENSEDKERKKRKFINYNSNSSSGSGSDSSIGNSSGSSIGNSSGSSISSNNSFIRIPLLKNGIETYNIYTDKNKKRNVNPLLLDSYKEYLSQREDYSFISQLPSFNIDNIIGNYNLYSIEEYEYNKQDDKEYEDLEKFIREIEEKDETTNENNDNKTESNDNKTESNDDNRTESGGEEEFDEETKKYFIEQEKYKNISKLPIDEIVLNSVRFKNQYLSS